MKITVGRMARLPNHRSSSLLQNGGSSLVNRRSATECGGPFLADYTRSSPVPDSGQRRTNQTDPQAPL